MTRLAAVLSLTSWLLPAGLPAQEKPVTVAYYYKVRWGHQQEFERLFFKNHYPILMAQRERMTNVHVFRPTYHGDGRADWTFLVVIQYASGAAMLATVDEDAIARTLFPDQDAYKKEEARRFEILDAHWDVPLTPVPPPS
jgi:hypothetical protein